MQKNPKQEIPSDFVCTQTRWTDCASTGVASGIQPDQLLVAACSGVCAKDCEVVNTHIHVFPACSMFSLLVSHCLCYSFSSMLRDCLSPQMLLAPFACFCHVQTTASLYIKASCWTSHPSRNRVSGCLNMIPMVGAKVHKGSMFYEMDSVVWRMFVFFYIVLFPIISAKDVLFDENLFSWHVVNSASKITWGSDIWTSVTMPSSEDLRNLLMGWIVWNDIVFDWCWYFFV